MTRSTTSGKALTGEDLDAIAEEFEQREFTADEVEEIKASRRRSPRIGETRAEVFAVRLPDEYRRRLKERAAAEHTTESDVLRDALDAYL